MYYYQDITLKLYMHEMYFELRISSWLSAKLLQLCVAQKLLFLKSNAIEISLPSGYTKYCMMHTGNTYPHHTLHTTYIGVA